MALRYALLLDGETIPSWAQPLVARLNTMTSLNQVARICLNSKLKNDFELLSIKKIFAESKKNAAIKLIHSKESDNLKSEFSTLKLDFILCLTSKTPTQDIFNIPTWGWWRFRFGDYIDINNMGVNEFFKNDLLQHIALEKLSGTELYYSTLTQGTFKVYKRCLETHRKSTLEQCAPWIASIAAQIVSQKKLPNLEQLSILKSIQPPSFFKKIAIPFIETFEKIKFVYKKIKRQFTFQQWNIGTIQQPIANVMNNNSLKKINWWTPPPAPICLADPFPVVIDDRLFVLAEKFSYIDQVGMIHSFKTDANGNSAESNEAIHFPFHLSYPSVVAKNGAVFATFEAIKSSEIAIYECKKFPHLWVQSSVISKGKFTDPTLFEYDGRWWVFATSYDTYSEGNVSLYAWYSESGLNGNWKPHLQNPIKCDIESSRSAGTPFFKDGKLFRPSQNCAQHYGHSIFINEIQLLTPTEFSEKKVKAIFPNTLYPDGIHHLAGAGEWTVVDGRRDQFSISIGLTKIWYYLNLKFGLIRKKYTPNQPHAIMKASLTLLPSVERNQ